MVNTLKITTIITAVLAVVFLMFSVSFGLRTDPEIERFLEMPGAIEKFKTGSAAKAEKQDQHSPLMKQAEAFALRIQPPKPKITRKPTRTIARPTTVKPKFTLIGTSIYLLDPLRSLALIDEPGKGLHWVKKADNVGHLTIEQINDGHILVRDGQRTETLYAIRPEKKSLIKGISLESPPKEFEPTSEGEITKAFEPTSEGEITKAFDSLRGQPPPSRSVRHRRKTRTETKTKQPDIQDNQDKSMGISSEEAEDLGYIGTMLKAMEEEILRIEREKQNANTASESNEPNSQ